MWKCEFRKMKMRVVVVIIIMSVLLTLVMAFKDWAVQEFSAVSQQVPEEKLPKFFRKFLSSKMEVLAQKLKEDDFYLWSQWFGKNFGQFVPLIALILAFPLFSREYERRTIYYLITRVKRVKIYILKSMTGFLALCFILILFSILPLFIALAMDWKIQAWKFIGYTLQALIGGTAFYSIFLLFSVLFKDQVKPILMGIVVIIGTAFLSISDKLRLLNIYSYIMSHNVFQDGKMDPIRTCLYVGFSIFLFLLSWLLFERREL